MKNFPLVPFFRRALRLGAVSLLLMLPTSVSAQDAVDAGLSVFEFDALWESIDEDGISDASLGGLDDAYDGVFQFVVNAEEYDTDSETVLRQQGPLGTEISLPGVVLDGDILTTPSFFFFSSGFDTPTVRVLVKLENTSNAAKSVLLGMEGDLGSDEDTRIANSSDGDQIPHFDDLWFVTTDFDPNNPDDEQDDPVNTFVTQGLGFGGLSSLTLSNGDGIFNFDLLTGDIPAGATRYVMFFAQLSLTEGQAVFAAEPFNTQCGFAALGGLIGLEADVIANIVNFPQLDCAQISGRVFSDVNANGIQDANEPGVPNMLVNLLGLDGQTFVGQRITDFDGEYRFVANPGNYFIEVSQGFFSQIGFTLKDAAKDDIDSDANQDTGRTDRFLAGLVPRVFDVGLAVTALIDSDNDGLPDSFDPCPALSPNDGNGNDTPDCLEPMVNVATTQIQGLVDNTLALTRKLRIGRRTNAVTAGVRELVDAAQANVVALVTQPGVSAQEFVAEVSRVNKLVRRAANAARRRRANFKKTKKRAVQALRALQSDFLLR